MQHQMAQHGQDVMKKKSGNQRKGREDEDATQSGFGEISRTKRKLWTAVSMRHLVQKSFNFTIKTLH